MASETSLIRMLRAPFFTSILSPLFAGTLLAILVSGSFEWLGFVLVLIMGLGLHGATNVYNDIYDTLQGTDRINLNRNDFSGGSGIIVENPDILPRMVRLARLSLVVALVATVGLMFVVDRELWPLLWALYVLSAFFSKFYTAAPVKLAYRGWGEISVWFAFGPMAILVAAVSQNVALHPFVLAALPTTGLSTTSILLIGEMNDEDADRKSDKMGVAARFGNRVARFFYIGVQLLLVANIALLATLIPKGWFIALALIPYLLIFPNLVSMLKDNYNDATVLKKAAGMNVQIHLLFSLLFSAGLLFTLLLN